MWRELKQDLWAQSNGGSVSARLKIALLNHSFHLVFFIRLGSCMPPCAVDWPHFAASGGVFHPAGICQ